MCTLQGGHLPMDNLPLPHVVTNDVTVHYSDQRCYGNAAAYALPDSTWHRLEGVVTGGSEMPATNWLDAVKQVRKQQAAPGWSALLGVLTVTVEARLSLRLGVSSA